MTANNPKLTVGIAAALAIITLLLYLPTAHFGYLNVDDNALISDNPYVYSGLSVSNTVWAAAHTYEGHWHPVTWMSHMLDVTLWGLNAGRSHLANAALHALNALLLFLLLRFMTGSTWRGALAAALFAWHPLNVEPVAWLAERKTLLGAFFWLLTLHAYTFYARKPAVPRYAAVVVLTGLATMANPLLSTLPLVLFLIDAWPLRRILTASTPTAPTVNFPPQSPGLILLEKLPLLAISAVGGALAWIAQRNVDHLVHATSQPLALRIAYAPIACVTYLAKAFYPADLYAFHPWPAAVPAWQAALALLLLLAITAVAIQQRTARPCLATGWLWFLVAIIPVLGLLPIGPQAMGDRFAYVPLIGIFIGFAWGLGELGAGAEWRKAAALFVTGVALLGCLAVSFLQLPAWKDSSTAFGRVLEKYGPVEIALNSTGMALLEKKDPQGAIDRLQKSLDVNPDNPVTLTNLASVLMARGGSAEARLYLARAIALAHNYAPAYLALGKAHLQMGEPDKAIGQLHAALNQRPLYPDATETLGAALYMKGDYAGSRKELLKALAQNPLSADFKNNLAWLLATCPEPSQRNGTRAVILAKEAASAAPGNASILDTLAAAYAETDQFDDAAETVRHAIALSGGDKNPTPFTQVLRARLRLYENRMPYQETAPDGRAP